jgi:2-dehydro-3-deoxygalactonokinase
MGEASFVAGDWGTSHLRLFLCDAQGAVLDSGSGPGAADAGGRFSEIFDSLTARWQPRSGALPAVLCGMVGSSIGWIHAPYLPCPAVPDQIADGCVAPRRDVHIVPGLSCHNRFAAPDFMRGEETQILGAVLLVPALRNGRRLLCLPGTHTKWAVLQDGAVQEFLSAPTGELFALLSEHSVLVRKPRQKSTVDADAFREGVSRFNEYPHAQLLHRLFECRSRMLGGELAAENAAAYLSGLLVASDVHGALSLLSISGSGPVYLIGSSELTQLYAMALASHGCAATPVDGAAAALAGLALVHRRISQPVAAHDA